MGFMLCFVSHIRKFCVKLMYIMMSDSTGVFFVVVVVVYVMDSHARFSSVHFILNSDINNMLNGVG